MNLSTMCMFGILKLKQIVNFGGLSKVNTTIENGQNELFTLANSLSICALICAGILFFFSKEKGKSLAIAIVIGVVIVQLADKGILEDLASIVG